VMEAMAAGVPVITSANAGSIARDGLDGFLVPYDDVEAQAQRVQRLRDDADLCRQMGHSAATRARQFTIQRYQQNLADLLLEALAPRQGAAA